MCLLAALPWKFLVSGGWHILLPSVASTLGPGTSGHSVGGCGVEAPAGFNQPGCPWPWCSPRHWERWGICEGDLRCPPRWPPRLLLSPGDVLGRHQEEGFLPRAPFMHEASSPVELVLLQARGLGTVPRPQTWGPRKGNYREVPGTHLHLNTAESFPHSVSIPSLPHPCFPLYFACS